MRIIDADALIESIKHGLWDWETVNGIESRTVLEQTIQDIRNEPTIDAEPVRHGKWIGKPIGGYSTVRCSECGDVFLENNGKWNYCPSCGAKMDEEENDETEKWNVFESTDDRIYEVIKQIRHQLDEEGEEQA